MLQPEENFAIIGQCVATLQNSFPEHTHWGKYFGRYLLLVLNLLSFSTVLGEKRDQNFFTDTLVINLLLCSTLLGKDSKFILTL